MLIYLELSKTDLLTRPIVSLFVMLFLGVKFDDSVLRDICMLNFDDNFESHFFLSRRAREAIPGSLVIFWRESPKF